MTRIWLRMKFLRQEEAVGLFCVGVAGGFVEGVSAAVGDNITFGDEVDLTIMQGLLSQSNTVGVVSVIF